MTGRRSFVIPRCSIHLCQAVKTADGWVCPTCMDEWMQKEGGQTEGGVELPDHVRDERLVSFAQILPNRRARRAVMRA